MFRYLALLTPLLLLIGAVAATWARLQPGPLDDLGPPAMALAPPAEDWPGEEQQDGTAVEGTALAPASEEAEGGDEAGPVGAQTQLTGSLLCQPFESGKKGSLAIANTPGDHGGASYGTFQFSSRTGVVQAFVQNYFPNDFKKLTPGTPSFDSTWAKVVGRDAASFKAKEVAFTKANYYEPLAKSLNSLGLDLGKRSTTLREAVWSTAVQHGVGGGKTVCQQALATLSKEGPLSKVSDGRILTALYAERGKRDSHGDLAYFRSNSPGVQKAVETRLNKEAGIAQKALATEQTGMVKGSTGISQQTVSDPKPPVRISTGTASGFPPSSSLGSSRQSPSTPRTETPRVPQSNPDRFTVQRSGGTPTGLPLTSSWNNRPAPVVPTTPRGVKMPLDLDQGTFRRGDVEAGLKDKILGDG